MSRRHVVLHRQHGTVLGRGGMGVVHRVTHLGWHTDLAVKSLLPGRVTENGRAAFVREAETWVSLGLHPHKDVGRFHVLVHRAALVRVGRPLRGLHGDVEDPRQHVGA